MSNQANAPGCVWPGPDQSANRCWWRKPLYWDNHEEPQYIGDVLFTLFIHFYPFFVVFACSAAALGLQQLWTPEGLKANAIIGVVLTLGWWYLLYRPTRR